MSEHPQPSPVSRPRRLRRAGAPATAAVAVLVAAGLIWNASYAAFSATTVTGSNTWTAGNVTITNDQSGSTLFNIATAKPAASATTLTVPGTGAYVASSTSSGGSACVKVTYSGNLTSNIRLRAALTNTGSNGGLSQFLLFSVDTGTDTAPGSDLSCSTFTSSGTYAHGSASNSNVMLSTYATTYATGSPVWDGATASTKWYRFSWLLPYGVSDNAQSQAVSAVFTWEAQNT